MFCSVQSEFTLYQFWRLLVLDFEKHLQSKCVEKVLDLQIILPASSIKAILSVNFFFQDITHIVNSKLVHFYCPKEKVDCRKQW